MNGEISCPLRIGQRVRVKQNHTDVFDWRADWRGHYVVVGLVCEYQRGGQINIWLASSDEIAHGISATDGFSLDDLEAVTEQPVAEAAE